jgi:hypothetical protein
MSPSTSPRWTPEQARTWHQALPWLVGTNFLPSTAINQLEMFQPEDYDRNRAVLARELDWSAQLGMNTHRVFLHDLLWSTDADGFFRRLDDFLGLCATRDIRPMLVFFDACHRPEPKPGVQPTPISGIHNPGWAQSPAVSTLTDERQWSHLERYVTSVLTRFGRDERVLCWDLYNEPCNSGFDGNRAKAPWSARLVPLAFAWARAASPSQPLTVGVWSEPEPMQPHDAAALDDYQKCLLEAQTAAVELSDIISFHHYSDAAALDRQIDKFLGYGRPIFCTEYMARTQDSRFQTCLPVLKAKGVAAYNWGFVSGKSQTIFPWRTPEGAPEPEVWFHDVLRPDGTPFDPEEPRLIRELSGAA